MRVLWSEGSHFEFVWFLNEWVAQIWLGVGSDVHTSVLHSETEDALSSCWCYDMLIISKLLWEKKEMWGEVACLVMIGCFAYAGRFMMYS